MFKSHHITNFQSHKDTHLDFDPGVNVIVGSSDCGKTAIIRSMLWVFYNRPMGTFFLSNWIKEKKKKKIVLIGEADVHLVLDDGTVIGRMRNESENQYYINKEEWDAPKSEVPEIIANALNISEVNIGLQMDQPFLIASSSGEVARFLNRVIHMEIIDETLSRAESYKRKTNKEIEAIGTAVIEIQEYIDSYLWIEEAEPLVKRHSDLEEMIGGFEEDVETLEVCVNKYHDELESMPRVSNWNQADKLTQDIMKISRDVDGIDEEIGALDHSINRFNSHKEQISTVDFDKGLSLLSEMVTIQSSRNDLSSEKRDLNVSITKIEEIRRSQKSLEARTQKMEEQIPDICPLCGAEIDEETKHEIAHNK